MLIGGVRLRLTWCDLKWCLNGASMVQLPMRAHSSLLFLRMPSASIISLLRYHQKTYFFYILSERIFVREINYGTWWSWFNRFWWNEQIQMPSMRWFYYWGICLQCAPRCQIPSELSQVLVSLTDFKTIYSD